MITLLIYLERIQHFKDDYEFVDIFHDNLRFRLFLDLTENDHKHELEEYFA